MKKSQIIIQAPCIALGARYSQPSLKGEGSPLEPQPSLKGEGSPLDGVITML
jgi:hypothetical protein